jgi:hypothetical protein
MNWKELWNEFIWQKYGRLYTPIDELHKEKGYIEITNKVEAFISTEIIEKLIADIREIDKSMQGWLPEEYKANFSSEVCSQLRDEYL